MFVISLQPKEELLAMTGHEPEWKIDGQRKLRQTVEESGQQVRHFETAAEGTALIQQVN